MGHVTLLPVCVCVCVCMMSPVWVSNVTHLFGRVCVNENESRHTCERATSHIYLGVYVNENESFHACE